MDSLKPLALVIIAIVLGILVVKLLKNILPTEGVAPIFIAMIIFGISFALVFSVGSNLLDKKKKK